MNIVAASKTLLRCGLRHPAGFLGSNTSVKYNTSTRSCSRRFDTQFMKLFRLMCSAKMEVGEAASDTAREHLQSWSIILTKTAQDSFSGTDTKYSVSGKSSGSPREYKKKRPWMHTTHEAAPGKHTVPDKAFVAQSVLFYNIPCGLVFKIQTQNLTCL